MKKFLIPSVLMSVLMMTGATQAETMSGKVVSMQNDQIQVAGPNATMPTTLKTTPNTKYYVKQQVSSDSSDMSDMADNMPSVNEYVEIVYMVDPATNELIVDELVVVEED